MRCWTESHRIESGNVNFKNLWEMRRKVNNESSCILCSDIYAWRLLCAQAHWQRPSKRNASKHLVSPQLEFLKLGLFQEKSFAVSGSVCTTTSGSGAWLWTVEERTSSSPPIFILPRQAALKHLKDEHNDDDIIIIIQLDQHLSCNDNHNILYEYSHFELLIFPWLGPKWLQDRTFTVLYTCRSTSSERMSGSRPRTTSSERANERK